MPGGFLSTFRVDGSIDDSELRALRAFVLLIQNDLPDEFHLSMAERRSIAQARVLSKHPVADNEFQLSPDQSRGLLLKFEKARSWLTRQPEDWFAGLNLRKKDDLGTLDELIEELKMGLSSGLKFTANRSDILRGPLPEAHVRRFLDRIGRDNPDKPLDELLSGQAVHAFQGTSEKVVVIYADRHNNREANDDIYRSMVYLDFPLIAFEKALDEWSGDMTEERIRRNLRSGATDPCSPGLAAHYEPYLRIRCLHNKGTALFGFADGSYSREYRRLISGERENPMMSLLRVHQLQALASTKWARRTVAAMTRQSEKVAGVIVGINHVNLYARALEAMNVSYLIVLPNTLGRTFRHLEPEEIEAALAAPK